MESLSKKFWPADVLACGWGGLDGWQSYHLTAGRRASLHPDNERWRFHRPYLI
jgi:hypothetical protein